MRKGSVIALLFCFGWWGVRAQDPLVEGLRAYQAGDLERARVLVDSAVSIPSHEEDAEAWLLRGFVYKDLYKQRSPDSDPDTLRSRALRSLDRCRALDTERTFAQNAEQAYQFVARSFYNDAAKALQDGREDHAIDQFDRFREAMAGLPEEGDLDQREVDFLNALGTAYTRRYNEDRLDTVVFDKAVSAYEHVLQKDTGNYGANYNLATLYYNHGVYNIQQLGVDNDLLSIELIQQVSKELFKRALPYMLKAHQMRPDRKETLLGLEGIYYSLQDDERSEEFRTKFEALPPDNE